MKIRPRVLEKSGKKEKNNRNFHIVESIVDSTQLLFNCLYEINDLLVLVPKNPFYITYDLLWHAYIEIDKSTISTPITHACQFFKK